MPTEVEELKLRVTLDDQASAQLTRVRQELSQIGSGPTAQGLTNVTGKASEAEKALARLTRSTLGVSHGMMDIAKVAGPWAGALSLAVVGIERHMAAMREWAASGQGLANAARLAGTSAASLKNIQEGFAGAGIGAEQAAAAMQHMQTALVEAGRPGSAVREQLLRLGGVENQAAMANAIDKLSQMRDIVDRTNYVRHMLLNAYANDLKKHHDEAHARAMEAQLARVLGAEEVLLLDKDIVKFGEQKSANITAENAKQKELNDLLVTEAQTRDRIWQIIQASTASQTAGAVRWLNRAEGRVARDLEATEARRAGRAPPMQVPPILNIPTPATGFQHGGIVRRPTMGLVGEAGPEAIIPLNQLGGDRKHTESIDENTKQLRSLNAEMEQILNPAMFSKYAGTVATGGALERATGGGPGGPGGRFPSGPSATTAAPGTPGGLAADLSSARMGMNPMWDDPRIRSAATAPGGMMGAIRAGGTTGHPGDPAMPWPAQQTASGGGPIDRSAYAAELAKNPALRDKILRIAYNEQGTNPEGTQAVIESLMNRAAVRGTSLEKEARWHESEGGYYQQGNMGRGALEDPGTNRLLNQSLGNALGGGNISNYATDNSSGDLARRERASGSFTYASAYHGETFFTPGTAEQDQVKRYNAWRQRLAQAGPVAAGKMPPAPFAGYGPYGQTPQAGAAGGPITSDAQKNRPMYMGGTGTIEGGQPFHWGSGMPGRYASIPYGDYPVTPGTIGGWGQAHGALGINNNSIFDPQSGRNREGIEIHTGSAGHLDKLYTEGCFQIAAEDWPRMRQQILDQAKQGPLYLHVAPGKDGGPPVASFTHSKSLLPDAGGGQQAASAPGLKPWPTAAAPAADGSALDGMMGKEVQKHDVDTSGTIKIKHDRAKGSTLTHRPPPFKDMPTNRQMQMMPANDGPVLGTNAASGI